MTSSQLEVGGWCGVDGDFAEIDIEEVRRRHVTITGFLEIQYTSRREREDVLVEAAAVRIAPAIGRSFTLEQVADAHTAAEQREIVGRAVLHP